MKVKGTIKAVAKEPRKYEGTFSIGVLLENVEAEDKTMNDIYTDTWLNANGTEDSLKELRNTILKKGNVIEFEADKGHISNILLIEGNIDNNSSDEVKGLKIGEEEIEHKSEKWQDEMVSFEDLLNDAHKKSEGKLSIESHAINIDFEKREAVFKAIVHFGEFKFEAHGDATMENIANDYIRPHFIRMAETRAIARALRWFTNNAKTADIEK